MGKGRLFYVVGMKGAIAKAEQLLKEIPGSYSPAQFSNAANPMTYYKTLGPEVWKQMDGRIDTFIAGAGTGGTFMGTARFLKEQKPSLRTVIVEPEGSILNGGPSGRNRTFADLANELTESILKEMINQTNEVLAQYILTGRTPRFRRKTSIPVWA